MGGQARCQSGAARRVTLRFPVPRFGGAGSSSALADQQIFHKGMLDFLGGWQVVGQHLRDDLGGQIGQMSLPVKLGAGPVDTPTHLHLDALAHDVFVRLLFFPLLALFWSDHVGIQYRAV